MLLWVASVTVPGPALMRGSRSFWWCAAARLQAVWRAVLSAGGGAWWVGLLPGVGATNPDHILLNPGFQNLAGHRNSEKGMVTAPSPLNAAALSAEPVVYSSGKVFLAMIVTLGQKLGAPEATPEHSAKDSKNIVEQRFEYSNE